MRPLRGPGFWESMTFLIGQAVLIGAAFWAHGR